MECIKLAKSNIWIFEDGGKVSVVADVARAPPSETDLFSDLTRGQTRGAANTITALT